MDVSSRKYKGYVIDIHSHSNSLEVRIIVWLNNKIIKADIVDAGKKLNGVIQARQWIDKQIIVIN